jgi:nucleoside-diphosphate-sugar epimerase
MRVLIVGCGYVGVPLGTELVRQGHQVWGLRRSPLGAAELNAAGICPVAADITRPETLAPLRANFDWVVNCVSSSGGSPEEYRKVYLEGTRNLLSWLRSTPPQKFVYSSSTSVYGQVDGSVVDETSPTAPESGTAKVLVQTEEELFEAVRERGFPAVVLRLAGIYGPDRGYWFKQFLKGEARLDGRGERILNMIHRDDVVGAVIAALRHGRPGQIYNVVDDEPVTQLTFHEWLSTALGKDLPPFGEIVAGTAKKRGTTNKRVSNRRLREELEYHCKFPTFREGYAAGAQRGGGE